MRVDHWLRNRYPGLTRRHVEEALQHRLVTSAGGGALAGGATFNPDAPPACLNLDAHLAALRAGNPDLRIQVLTESTDVIAVDKPARIPGHPISLLDRDTVTHWAFATYPEILGWATACQPTITPHRLDTGTSGILLVARTADAYAQWRQRFSAGQVEKTYLAWCRGIGPVQTVICTLPVAHDPSDRRRMICISEGGIRRVGRIFAAETQLRTLEQKAGHFLCELKMRTGVTHQIRVHMAALGNPLLGDSLYGPGGDSLGTGTDHALLRCVSLVSGDRQFHAPDAGFRHDPLG